MASIATGSVLAGNSSRREPLHPASIDSFRFLDQKNSSFEMSLKLPVELQGADLIQIKGLNVEGRVWMCVESHLGRHFEVHSSFLALFGTITCDDGTTHCSDECTCCRDPYGGYGCCPSAGAECCSDLVHCCPSGERCVDGSRCQSRVITNEMRGPSTSFAIVTPTIKPGMIKEPPLEARYVPTEEAH